ncbi:MAG: ECF transporter S component [Clostridium sp.]|nr:ECF transporter S component [Clostridium sp.]
MNIYKEVIIIMNTRKTILSALFLGFGLVLPFFTMQIPAVGNMLLPMHIPVLLCGFICGAPYGAVVGFILPLLRSSLLGTPVMMPVAIAMSVELLFYGMLSGLLYRRFKNYRFGIYLTLIPTMIIGRIAWGIAEIILFNALGNSFTWMVFVTQGFIKAVPGIILQLFLIPVVVARVDKVGMEVLKNDGTSINN